MTHTQEEIKEALKQHQLYKAYQIWLTTEPETRGEEPPKGVRFTLNRLSGANLYGANLKGANLWNANLREANLSNANLREANLTGANLREADLTCAGLSYADLSGANLTGAILMGANLRRAILSGANLTGANLSGAILYGANLSGAILSGAILMGANLRRAIGNGKEVKSMQTDRYVITWTATHLAIGCQQHPLANWLKFTDEEKANFAPDAIEYLNKWLPILDSMGVFDIVKKKETNND